jgi:anti-sigma regulatory factor (Ser/Thr protein kinase)
MNASAEFTFSISSTPAALSAAVKMVRNIMEWMGFDYDTLFRAELCLHEALLNAHCHGNHEISTRTIRVKCTLAPDKVEMDVADDGEGYDVSLGSDVCEQVGLHGRGRGLYLIRQLMHSVGIHGHGTRIVMSVRKE